VQHTLCYCICGWLWLAVCVGLYVHFGVTGLRPVLVCTSQLRLMYR